MSHCNKKMISFFLTTKCNLCCRYCYNAKERNEIEEHSLSLDIAKAGIDWYFETNESRHIRFYGPGEPTQEFENLRNITEYAKNHPNNGSRVTVEIQTNGVFTENIRNWILDNVNIMWLSFDGMKEIQNFNRPLNPKFSYLYNNKTSADIIESNVKWLNENKKQNNLMIGARVTITDKNIDNQIEMIDYFYDLGISYVWTNPIFYSVGKTPVCKDAEKKKAYSFDMNKYVDNYLLAYEYAKKKGVFWGSFLTINFDGESSYHCRCCTPLNAPHLTPDGYISACDMVVLGAEAHHMDLFIVGKWNNETRTFDLNYEKIKKLNERKSTNMEHCKNCSVKMHCGGCCLGETVNEFGVLDGQNKEKCLAIRKLFAKLGESEPYPYLHP
ncbi:radical SAM protein [uncultured Eubacterium sp.]|uniref:radical SAM protein n=1 Tax=uncultured Eubacterium sp. TaxID=165185 RepID=UPI00261063DA|nr:radical SAM protein [uncultured Eubacterium sp.]